MRILEMHASLKEVKRSAGRSAVAAAAYRAGACFKDERTGIVYDFRRKGGVEHERIYLPDNAPHWARDRHKLWNGVELKEKKSNAMTAHEWEVAFPYEFNIMQRREAGDAISKELMRRYGCAVDIAYHAPSPDGDERNYHAHIMFTTRAFDSKSKDGWKRTKFRDLSKDKVTVNGEKVMSRSHELKTMRKFIAYEMNMIAERERMPIRTEYKSYKARGIDKIPTKKEGQEVTAMKRKGQDTRRAELNRRIKARNERNFKMLVGIQVQAQQQKIKKIDKKQAGRGLFASLFSLFTGGSKNHKAERAGLETAIKRKRDTIKNPEIAQQRQINRTSNSNVGQRDTINHRFKANQAHSTIEDHKGLNKYTVKNVLEKHDERIECYKEMVDRQRTFNDKSQQKTHDRGREIGD